MTIAQVILLIAGLYLGAGVILGGAFVMFGVGSIDPAAVDAPWSVRLLLWPGSTALWPVVMTKWMRCARARRQAGGRAASDARPAHGRRAS